MLLIEGHAMAIDFNFTPEQRQLQLSAWRFAAHVLTGVAALRNDSDPLHLTPIATTWRFT